MTAKPDIPPTLDPLAFVLALVLAPLLVALVFFWALLIPVFAVIFGGLPYLVFGTPVLLWLATRAPLRPGRYALVGMGVHGLFLACLAVWSLQAQPDPRPMLAFFGGFGLPMAALWFAAFALLYRRFWRPVPSLMS